jgi:hypothetical protein
VDLTRLVQAPLIKVMLVVQIQEPLLVLVAVVLALLVATHLELAIQVKQVLEGLV